jgi:hypothetical protein
MTLYNEVLPEFQHHDAQLLEYQSMAFGVTSPFRRTENFDFHYFRTLNQKVR